MKEKSSKLLASLLGTTIAIGSEYMDPNMLGSKPRKQSYCHTCIVGKKNPELCEKCDRK